MRTDSSTRPVWAVKSGGPDADARDMAGRAGSSDQGGIVLGWLMRVAVVLAVLGVMAFDVFSLAYTSVTTGEDASILASTGAETLLERPGDYDGARARSEAQAEELGVLMRGPDWWVDDRGEVHVTVTRTASSLALQHIPPLRKYLTVRAVGTARVG